MSRSALCQNRHKEQHVSIVYPAKLTAVLLPASAFASVADAGGGIGTYGDQSSLSIFLPPKMHSEAVTK